MIQIACVASSMSGRWLCSPFAPRIGGYRVPAETGTGRPEL